MALYVAFNPYRTKSEIIRYMKTIKYSKPIFWLIVDSLFHLSSAQTLLIVSPNKIILKNFDKIFLQFFLQKRGLNFAIKTTLL